MSSDIFLDCPKCKNKIKVNILACKEATEDVIEKVEEFNLPKGLEQAWVTILNVTINSLNKNHTTAAVNQLQAFEHQVEAQRGKRLNDEEANELIAAAQWIIENINNE